MSSATLIQGSRQEAAKRPCLGHRCEIWRWRLEAREGTAGQSERRDSRRRWVTAHILARHAQLCTYATPCHHWPHAVASLPCCQAWVKLCHLRPAAAVAVVDCASIHHDGYAVQKNHNKHRVRVDAITKHEPIVLARRAARRAHLRGLSPSPSQNKNASRRGARAGGRRARAPSTPIFLPPSLCPFIWRPATTVHVQCAFP